MAQSRQKERASARESSGSRDAKEAASGAGAEQLGTQGSAQMGGDGPTSASGNQGQMAMGQVQEQAGQMLQVAREQASSQLSSQKERAVGSLSTLGSVLHEAGRQAREQDEAMIGQYIGVVADQVDNLANAVRDQDFNQLIMNTGQFARRQPALFMAAAFAVGFAGARLLKGSSQQSGDWSGDSRRSEMSGERWGRYPGSGYDTSQSGGGSFGSAGYASSAFGGAGFGSDYPPSGAGAGSSSSYGNGDTSRPESGAGYSGAWSGGSRSAGTGSYEAGSTATGSGSTEGGDALLGSDWSARGTGSLSEER